MRRASLRVYLQSNSDGSDKIIIGAEVGGEPFPEAGPIDGMAMRRFEEARGGSPPTSPSCRSC